MKVYQDDGEIRLREGESLTEAVDQINIEVEVDRIEREHEKWGRIQLYLERLNWRHG